MKKNKIGVSAVWGVVLMIAITIAIAATVYIYVDISMHEENNIIEISGNITGVKTNSNKQNTITIDDKELKINGNILGIECLLGKNVTLILDDTGDTYKYIGVKVNQ